MEDDLAGTFHLGVLDGSAQAVGAVTLTPGRPGFAVRDPAYRLRQMAVHPERQGEASARPSSAPRPIG